jgi:hypothetical protein
VTKWAVLTLHASHTGFRWLRTEDVRTLHGIGPLSGPAWSDPLLLRQSRLGARLYHRLCEIVGLVGYALGGLPGERLLNRLGITSSDDTVLRRVKARRRGAIQPAVRVLSVDDWAWRKKQRYG